MKTTRKVNQHMNYVEMKGTVEHILSRVRRTRYARHHNERADSLPFSLIKMVEDVCRMSVSNYKCKVVLVKFWGGERILKTRTKEGDSLCVNRSLQC